MLLANLLINGGFEQPKVPAEGFFRTLDTGSAELTGWTIAAGNLDVVGNQPAAEGTQSLDLNGTAPAVLRQEFATVAGTLYRLSFQYGNNPGGAIANPSALVQVIGAAETLHVSETIAHSGSTFADMRYTPFSASFTANSTTTALRFQSMVDGNAGVVLDAVAVEPPLVLQSADLGVAVQAPASVAPGANLTYEMSVTNRGPDVARTIRLDGTLPAQATFVSLLAPANWTAGTPAVGASGAFSLTTPDLPAGATASFTMTVRVAPGTPDGTALSTTATVASNATDKAPTDNKATHVAVVKTSLPVADLGVAVAAPGTVVVGEELKYTVIVSNRGPGPSAPGARLTFPVPVGATFVSATTTAGTVAMAGGTVTANLGPIAGAPATVTIVVRPTAAGTLTAVARVAGDFTDPNPANDAAEAVAIANALPVRVSARELALHQNQERRAYLAFARALRAQFRRTDSLTRASVERTLRDVLADLRAHWREEARTRTVGAPFVLPALGAPPATDLSVSLAATPQPLRLAAGLLTYTATVTNRGPNHATGVTLVDTLPAGADFVSATGGVAPVKGVLTFRVGDLDRGATRTFTIAVLPGSVGTLVNTAVLSANEADTNATDNTANAAALVSPAPVTATPAQIRVNQRAELRAFLAFREDAATRGLREKVERTIRDTLRDLREHWAAETRTRTVAAPFDFPDL